MLFHGNYLQQPSDFPRQAPEVVAEVVEVRRMKFLIKDYG
jgi:hypothetical protein